MDQITHSIRHANWVDVVNRCQARAEGMTVRHWLETNGIKEKAYYYWLRRIRKETFENVGTGLNVVNEKSVVSFAEIQLPRTIPAEKTSPDTIKPTAVIKTTTMTIALSNDVSDDLLSRILQEVRHA